MNYLIASFKEINHELVQALRFTEHSSLSLRDIFSFTRKDLLGIISTDFKRLSNIFFSVAWKWTECDYWRYRRLSGQIAPRNKTNGIHLTRVIHTGEPGLHQDCVVLYGEGAHACFTVCVSHVHIST